MIEAYSFGRMVVNGTAYRHDLKIIRHTVRPDWWRQNGHRVTPKDIVDLVDAAPDTIIIGTGASGMMIPGSEISSLLKNKGIEFIKAPTAEAVDIFNRLTSEQKNIAAGFHLTC